MDQKILMVAEAVTLAHVARIAVLARELSLTGFKVCVARDPRYRALMGELPCAERDIRSINSARFLSALAKGSRLYDTSTLRGYVKEELDIIRGMNPLAVVGDFRLSLSVSCALAKVPYINITNAYWSPYARLRIPVPDLPLTRILGVRAGQSIFDRVRPLAFAWHARPLNRLRRAYGLDPIEGDLRAIYTSADYTCYADTPGLVPMNEAMPEHHRFIGPLLWEPEIPLPPWWDDLPGQRPLVYVTMGSSGQTATLPAILQGLLKLDLVVMVATAQRARVDAVPGRVFTADYLPGQQAAQRASLVVCNGGSPTTQQALMAGVPVLGIPANLDQHLNMSALEEAGLGRVLRTEWVTAERVTELVTSLLGDEAVRARVLQAAESAKAVGREHRFVQLVEEIRARA